MIWLALVLIRYMPENPVSPETIYIAGPGKDAGGLTKLSHKDNLRMKYSLILMLSPPGLSRTDRSGGRGRNSSRLRQNALVLHFLSILSQESGESW